MSAPQTIERSIVIDAPLEAVWKRIRDFDWDWLPRDPSAPRVPVHWTGPANEPGTERQIEMSSGGRVAERLLAIDDEAHAVTYSLVESPFPISEHVATLAASEDSGSTRLRWTATFTAADDVMPMLEGIMGGQAFEPGLANVKRLLER